MQVAVARRSSSDSPAPATNGEHTPRIDERSGLTKSELDPPPHRPVRGPGTTRCNRPLVIESANAGTTPLSAPMTRTTPLPALCDADADEVRSRKTAVMREVQVEYAVRDGASIAYEVFGSGPVDLVTNQSRYPIDLMWDLPQLADFMDALGQVARVIDASVGGGSWVHGDGDGAP
jgi:hypothetical protein